MKKVLVSPRILYRSPKSPLSAQLRSQKSFKSTFPSPEIQIPWKISKASSKMSRKASPTRSSSPQKPEPDESFKDRLFALSEMFPAAIFSSAGRFFVTAFQIICDASWVFFTTLAIIYGPIVFETENERRNSAVSKLSDFKDEATSASEASQSPQAANQ